MHALPEGLNGIKLDLNEFDMNDWFLIPRKGAPPQELYNFINGQNYRGTNFSDSIRPALSDTRKISSIDKQKSAYRPIIENYQKRSTRTVKYYQKHWYLGNSDH